MPPPRRACAPCWPPHAHAIAAGDPAPADGAWAGLVQAHLAAMDAPSLRPVINATGVIVHTNLGRAPLSRGRAGRGAGRGRRLQQPGVRPGRRQPRQPPRPRPATPARPHRRRGCHGRQQQRRGRLSGAQRALPGPRGAHQPRPAGGDRRRLPHPRRAAPERRAPGGGRHHQPHPPARLRRRASTAETAAIMRVHSSNFRQVGFVTMPDLDETGRAGPRAAA